MRTALIAAAIGLLVSAGAASADPWKDESGHGRSGGKHWKHDGRGHHGWGRERREPEYRYRRPRGEGYGYYSERRRYVGRRYYED